MNGSTKMQAKEESDKAFHQWTIVFKESFEK